MVGRLLLLQLLPVFGCFIGAKGSTLVTKLPHAGRDRQFQLVTTGCHVSPGQHAQQPDAPPRVVSAGPDLDTRSRQAVIVAPFIYDNPAFVALQDR